MTIKESKAGTKLLKLFSMLFIFLCVAFQAYADSSIRIEDKALDVATPSPNKGTIVVKGTITHAGLNEPLIGVSVLEKGSPNNGITTDWDGKYTLTVAADAELVVRYVGFVSQTIKVDNRTTINIELKEDVQSLEEVVVVGYSTQKKADLTGAVASVKMENLKDMASTGISNALQGRMSGVTILQNSGAPGAGTSIHVRGVGTFGNKEPLYVIDGVPADNMNDVNPSDIERVDVLKDASSSAIYGSRAANGVVLIQTKRGKEGKPSVSFNTYHGISTPAKKMKMLDAQQRNMIHKEAYEATYSDSNRTPKDLESYENALKIYNDPFMQETRTKWQDEIFKSAAYQSNYDLSVAGGAKDMVYSVMLGHFNQDGVLKESSFNRTTLRVNTEIELFKGFKLGESMMISHSKQKIVPDMQANGAVISALRADPSVPMYTEDGKYSGSGLLNPDIVHPYATLARADRARTRDRIFGNVYAEYSFLNDFKIKTDFGYDWTDLGDNWWSGSVPEAGRANTSNELTVYDSKSVKWMNTTTISYNKEIGKHKLMLLGGHAYEYYKDNFFDARGTDFLSEDKNSRYLAAATNIAWSRGGKNDNALDSWFGRLDYSFAEKYLISASFRADGSSKFAPGNRWGYFPSVSGGWRISEESFFESLKPIVDNLKIRGSWGMLGNENLAFAASPYYPTLPIYINTTDDNDGDGYYVVHGQGENAVMGRFPSTLPNPDLKWEKTTQYDVGLDFSILGKFDFGLDYYSKDSKDVLVNIPVPKMSGYSSQIVNAATVRNSGFEISGSYTTRLSNGLDIRAYGNFATVKNEVRSLGDGKSFSFTQYRGNNINRVEEGQPLAFLYGYKTDGIFKTQAEIDAYVNKDGKKIQPDAKPGDIKFLDLDGSGGINGDDRTKIGSGFPKLTYGFGVDLAYKGFDLNMFFQGVGGSEIFNGLKYEGMFVNPRYNQYEDILDRFHPVNNPDGSLPRVTTNDKNGNRDRISDYYVESGSYLRMKALTLGYTLDRKLVQKLHLQKLRVYVTAQNLFTITPYSGFDPDLGNAYSNELNNTSTDIGIDRGQFPQPRTFILGVNINF